MALEIFTLVRLHYLHLLTEHQILIHRGMWK